MTLLSYRAIGVLIILCASGAGFALDWGGQQQSYPAAPKQQSLADVSTKSSGCMTCHTRTDKTSMHASPGVKLGCVDCHGGNAKVRWTEQGETDSTIYNNADKYSDNYHKIMLQAHVKPDFPEAWGYNNGKASSANPERTYTLLNKENRAFIRFVNPSDYRVVDEACGACHSKEIQAAKTSLMATGAMLWGGASYNNGILPYKNYLLGEAYDENGIPAMLKAPVEPTPEMRAKGVLPALYPLPVWETVKPGDIFRVFERGGRNILSLFPETGLPNVVGNIQRLEEPGRPDIKQSNRGEGTGGRIAVPLINIHKTRLNDPFTWFMGTNDQPGDFRHSGCASCHVVYANDRDERHSGPYAKYGHMGESQSTDPTIAKNEPGHPLEHSFTRAIPSSQCMICHMHQPNMFMNTFLGYTMWDYESDAQAMWPKEQKYPSHDEIRKINDRNPEGAATRGNWGDLEFLKNVSDLNPSLKDTQFADYHGHGWNFRAIFKRDRKGNLLDEAGDVVADDDPKKFDKAVHMSSIHVDVGMHCVDCHFSQDSHGNGHLYGEVAAAVEIDCVDCHGTSKAYPSLITSGPAALEGGRDLSLIRNPDGKKRFEWVDGKLIQRSIVNEGLEWEVSLVKDSLDKNHAEYNDKAARAKLMSRDTNTQAWGQNAVNQSGYAHPEEELECYACHTSWTTSCGGCHLPIESNHKTDRHHYEGGETRNFATYNPQVARDEIFILGKREPSSGARVAPVRSSSALVLSSTNANREKIYIQQPPIAASGYSSQAFNPHYPHTERKTETKTCSDCHLSEANDNNAIFAQTLGLGTQYIDFLGYYAWVGGKDEVAGVQVTEWEEPQAVIGSYLHKYAYPDWFEAHQAKAQELVTGHSHSSKAVSCLQMRGEYLYTAEGDKGMRVYDIASIANKGVSQRIISAPFSPLGQDSGVVSEDAACVVLATTQPVQPSRNVGDLMRVDNQEQATHPIYKYAIIVDRVEGLILVDIDTLHDGEPRNNQLERALTWNPNGALNQAHYAVVGGSYLYVLTDKQVLIVDMKNPLKPSIAGAVAMNDPRGADLQFRYLFVTDKDGLKVLDVTQPTKPRITQNNSIAISDAQRVFVARTYAYVAAAKEGVVIVDIERPERMQEYQRYNAAGKINDARDIVIAMTNASLFAYIADGAQGLKVVQLMSPQTQPKFYGFSPDPKPELIAHYPTSSPALSLSKALERDRAVDETGGQIAVFGRLGSRPFNQAEMQQLYLNDKGEPWFVKDE